MYLVLRKDDLGKFIVEGDAGGQKAAEVVAVSIGHGTYTLAKVMGEMEVGPPKRVAETVVRYKTANPKPQQQKFAVKAEPPKSSKKK